MQQYPHRPPGIVWHVEQVQRVEFEHVDGSHLAQLRLVEEVVIYIKTNTLKIFIVTEKTICLRLKHLL